MIKSRRSGVRKGPAARRFKSDAHKTHPMNLRMAPQRGGWRL